MNVFKGRVEAFETMSVKLEVESVHGQLTRRIRVLTTVRVRPNAGNLRIIDREKDSSKWKHLQGIECPRQTCLDLHYAYKDAQGFPEEPIARRTALA